MGISRAYAQLWFSRARSAASWLAASVPNCDGQPVGAFVGTRPKAKLLAELDTVLCQ